MNVVLPSRMTVDEFLAWAVRQEKGKYELFDGRVVMQQPQSWGHADIAWRVANLLAAVIERSGALYATYGDDGSHQRARSVRARRIGRAAASLSATTWS